MAWEQMVLYGDTDLDCQDGHTLVLLHESLSA